MPQVGTELDAQELPVVDNMEPEDTHSLADFGQENLNIDGSENAFEYPSSPDDRSIFYPSYYEEEVSALEAEAAIAEGAPVTIKNEPPVDEPATYIHYSLLKKRERKYVPPRK